MCTLRHDIDRLIKECDRERDRQFRLRLEALQEQWRQKREFEEMIKSALNSTADERAVVVAQVQHEPDTFVMITVKPSARHNQVFGIGFASCQGRDEWIPEEGVRIATKKARRHAARRLAGLDARDD